MIKLLNVTLHFLQQNNIKHQIYKFTCAVLPLKVICLYFGTK